MPNRFLFIVFAQTHSTISLFLPPDDPNDDLYPFLDEARQIAYQDQYDLRLLTPLRAGMQPNAFVLPKALRSVRQLVETVNGQLVERFKVQEMRVRKGWTLLARWFRKILTHTVCVWLNLQFGRKPLDFSGLVTVK